MGSQLQRELKKRNPFESLQEEAILSLLRTADLLEVSLARLFRGHGLTPSQYNILRILRGEGRPLPVLEIASRTITVVPGITGLVDRLEKAGLLGRKRCEKDRRVVFVELTAKGRDALAKLDEPLRKAHGELLGHMRLGELEKLTDLLGRARGGLVGEADDE